MGVAVRCRLTLPPSRLHSSPSRPQLCSQRVDRAGVPRWIATSSEPTTLSMRRHCRIWRASGKASASSSQCLHTPVSERGLMITMGADGLSRRRRWTSSSTAVRSARTAFAREHRRASSISWMSPSTSGSLTLWQPTSIRSIA